jgi:hypothetical protein
LNPELTAVVCVERYSGEGKRKGELKYSKAIRVENIKAANVLGVITEKAKLRVHELCSAKPVPLLSVFATVIN